MGDMDQNIERQIARLVELTSIKASYLKKILDITRSQAKAIDESMLDSMNALLDGKQLLIDSIDKTDKEFNRIYSEFQDKPIKMAAALQTSIVAVQKLINDITEIEQENFKKMQSAIEQVKHQLKDANNGKRGLSAYKRASLTHNIKIIDKSK